MGGDDDVGLIWLPVRDMMTDQMITLPVDQMITLPVDDGSPWSVVLTSSTEDHRPAAVGVNPRVRYSVHMSGRPVDGTRDLGRGILEPEWRLRLKEAHDVCVSGLRDRQVPVPDRFSFELESALLAARKQAILLVIRHQAALLIRHISSEEACHEWALAEALHILEM